MLLTSRVCTSNWWLTSRRKPLTLFWDCHFYLNKRTVSLCLHRSRVYYKHRASCNNSIFSAKYWQPYPAFQPNRELQNGAEKCKIEKRIVSERAENFRLKNFISYGIDTKQVQGRAYWIDGDHRTSPPALSTVSSTENDNYHITKNFYKDEARNDANLQSWGPELLM